MIIIASVGYLVTACLFNANLARGSSKFSFSMTIEKKHLQKYLLLHSIVDDRNIKKKKTSSLVKKKFGDPFGWIF